MNDTVIRHSSDKDINFIYDSLLSMAHEEKIGSRFSVSKDDLNYKLHNEEKFAEALIAEINDIPVGLVVFSETNRNFNLFPKPGMYIHDIYVLPEYRKRGIASSIISKERDYCRIDWVVLKGNNLGKRFFASVNSSLHVDYVENMRIYIDS